MESSRPPSESTQNSLDPQRQLAGFSVGLESALGYVFLMCHYIIS
jgi:hypothetical protein